MKFSLARNISFRFQKALFTVLFLILHSGVFPQSTTEQPDSTPEQSRICTPEIRNKRKYKTTNNN